MPLLFVCTQTFAILTICARFNLTQNKAISARSTDLIINVFKWARAHEKNTHNAKSYKVDLRQTKSVRLRH